MPPKTEVQLGGEDRRFEELQERLLNRMLDRLDLQSEADKEYVRAITQQSEQLRGLDERLTIHDSKTDGRLSSQSDRIKDIEVLQASQMKVLEQLAKRPTVPRPIYILLTLLILGVLALAGVQVYYRNVRLTPPAENGHDVHIDVGDS